MAKSKPKAAKAPKAPARKPRKDKSTPAAASTDAHGFTSVAALRSNARKNIDDGAVTQTYTADKAVVIAKLNEALATEWVCVLRYMRHYFTAQGMFAESIKAEFLAHAQEEQAHADQIAERIVQLGGEPDLNPDTLTARSHAEYKVGKDIKDMVRENLIAERVAIDSYREIINFIGDKDTTTKRMLEGILAMEEEHADEFADLLNGWIGD